MGPRKLLSALMLLGIAQSVAIAQSFPTKPIHIVVGFAPGGSVDILARVIAGAASKSFPTPVIVENRPGASAIIATQYVKNSNPDGHTLLWGGNIFVVAPHLVNPTPYDPVKDFQPIIRLTTTDVALMVNGQGPQTVAELITLSKSRPTGLSYSSPGIGTISNLAGEMFKGRTGIQAVHIPFSGDAPATQALLAKTVDFMFIPVPGVMAMISQGRLRALAVTSSTRAIKLPNVPTSAEAGLSDVELQTWSAILAPAGVPSGVIALLHKAFSDAANSPEFRAKTAEISTDIRIGSADEATKLIQQQSTRFAALIKEAGIKAN
jgi:tripartite-type tricarboxylate transporter receptor subunit TctC